MALSKPSLVRFERIVDGTLLETHPHLRRAGPTANSPYSKALLGCIFSAPVPPPLLDT